MSVDARAIPLPHGAGGPGLRLAALPLFALPGPPVEAGSGRLLAGRPVPLVLKCQGLSEATADKQVWPFSRYGQRRRHRVLSWFRGHCAPTIVRQKLSVGESRRSL